MKRGAARADGMIHAAFTHDFNNYAAAAEADKRAIDTLGAALAGSDRRLIVTSGTLLAQRQGPIAVEDDTPNPNFPRKSEEAARALISRGVNVAMVRLPPSVHGAGDHGFVPTLINLAREKGVSAYIGDGLNRWPAVHRVDAADLYRPMLEKGSAGFDSTFHGFPTVCDNGRAIVYYSDTGGRSLWKLDARSGNVTQIPNTTTGFIPTCAAEGETIFFWGQQADGSSYVFKVPFSGGIPARFSDRVAISPPFLSLDGKHLLFATPMKDGSVGGAVFSAETGKLEGEISVPPTFDLSVSTLCWMPDNRSVAYPDLRSGVANLRSRPVLGAGPQKQLTYFTSGKLWACAFSADGKYVAISHGSRQSDAVLFTNSNSAK